VPGAAITEFTVTSGITRGESYLFRVRAKNLHGAGEWSEQTRIKAAGIPF